MAEHPPRTLCGGAHAPQHFTEHRLPGRGLTLPPPPPHVVPHHYRNTLLAMERVLGAGYRRPRLLTLHRQEDAMVRLHVAAFMAYQQKLAAGNRVRLMNSPQMTPASIRTWFDDQRPDVILTTNYPPNIHPRETGIRVPRDVALVSLLCWDE